MSKSHQCPQRVQYNPRFDDTISVQLAQVFDGCYPLLILLEVVVLESREDLESVRE